jgi:hypothetical protein
MKKYLFLIVVAALLTACSSTKMTPQQKAEKAAKKEQMVFNAVRSKNFTMNFTYMTPFRGASRAIDYGYNVRISGDSIYSSLPYTGVAEVASYTGDSPLFFGKKMESCNITPTPENSLYMEIVVKNKEDKYVYMMNIFPNGTSGLRIQCQNRDPISFSGEMKQK